MSEEIRKSSKSVPPLSEFEIVEIRRFISAISNSLAPRADEQEKVLNMRLKISALLDGLYYEFKQLKQYASYQIRECQPTDATFEYRHVRSSAMQLNQNAEGAKSETVGFVELSKLQYLSMEARVEFFVGAVEFCEALFGEDFHGIRKMREEAHSTDDLVKLHLCLLRMEDIVTEVKVGLKGIFEKASSDF